MSYTPIDPEILLQIAEEQGTLAALMAVNNVITAAALVAQGTMATSSSQTSQITLETTGNAIATVVMNAQGTHADKATLTQVMNNQGTISTVQIWGTGSYQGQPAVGQFVNLNNGRLGVIVAFDDSPVVDAFNRLRVSNPAYRFDGQFVYQFNTDTWDSSSTSGSIAYDVTNRTVTLANNAGTNVTVLQSHYHAPYTPGRSQLAFMSFNMKTAPTSGQTKRVGYFDGNNGVFLEWDATNGISVNIISGTQNGNQRVTQANWNVDKLDGNGLSGITLDLTKTQIFFASIQALYVGRVVVGFDIDGRLVPVHAFLHANKVAYPYIQQASQPIRYEVRGTNATGCNMDAICASVISEGGEELLDIPGRAFAVSQLAGTNTTTEVPLFAIRPKQTINGVRNQGLVLPQQITAYSRTNGARIRLIRNGTVTPAVWADVSTQNSMVEYTVAATAVTGGDVVYTAFVPSDGAITFPLNPDALGRVLGAYSHILPVNPADTFVVTAASVQATAVVQAGISWKEIR